MNVEQCPQCGAPASPSDRKCAYCKAEFFVTSIAYLSRFDKPAINKYINHYKQLLRADPDNGELNLAMGICYLDLGLFDLAAKYCSIALEQTPDNADAYYYCAIALLKGRKPKILTLTEIKKIEPLLVAATQLDNTKAQYFYLHALIKYDFYLKNGLRLNPPTVEELMAQASSLHVEKEEIDKLFQRVPVEMPDNKFRLA